MSTDIDTAPAPGALGLIKENARRQNGAVGTNIDTSAALCATTRIDPSVAAFSRDGILGTSLDTLLVTVSRTAVSAHAVVLALPSEGPTFVAAHVDTIAATDAIRGVERTG